MDTATALRITTATGKAVHANGAHDGKARALCADLRHTSGAFTETARYYQVSSRTAVTCKRCLAKLDKAHAAALEDDARRPVVEEWSAEAPYTSPRVAWQRDNLDKALTVAAGLPDAQADLLRRADYSAVNLDHQALRGCARTYAAVGPLIEWGLANTSTSCGRGRREFVLTEMGRLVAAVVVNGAEYVRALFNLDIEQAAELSAASAEAGHAWASVRNERTAHLVEQNGDGDLYGLCGREVYDARTAYKRVDTACDHCLSTAVSRPGHPGGTPADWETLAEASARLGL